MLLFLPQLHLPPFLALLPSLLKSDCAEIVCKSLDIVGAASLATLEMSEQIAAEDEIVKRLIALVRNSKREIAIAACNAVLDLSAASAGRLRLLDFRAIENFMEPNLEEIQLLQLIPTDISETFLVHLRGLLGAVHEHRLHSTSSTCDKRNDFFAGNIRVCNLVESVFMLSINRGLLPESIYLEYIKSGIFGSGEASIESFFSEVWEVSPKLLRNASNDLLSEDSIFNPFLQYHRLKDAIPSSLPSMLKCFTSCPAIVADELDILHVIEEIKSHLGYPIIYNQDIRVVKTQSGEQELHYFQKQPESRCSISPHIFSINDILECEEAFKKGYSIALRGMEFRCQTISVIADELASLFGQPSAGVNMYLTPSDSQGLARHSDDHCVFVCQLIGTKRWKVYPRPDSKLPRLYEPCYSLHGLEDEGHEGHEHQQFVLKEGDILYIPRGFPHEAITDVDDDNVATVKFSLHMTLAIEIEPPFE
ncbi:hypothetical protein SASPL_128614 [Salvia splendens]|uniref:Bifunctional lysine-specific demethylase and histidyl-hydroxylase n=1 Tax=Salvia splendens TaxID=180675 RepID=A0A8X8XEF3_SALSN|nr:hypothetical protein SASPL_128614 [Salvia splendens]